MFKIVKSYFGFDEFPPQSFGEMVGLIDLNFKSKMFLLITFMIMTFSTITAYVVIK